MAHLTCVGHTTEELERILDSLRARPGSATCSRCAATRWPGRAPRGSPTEGGIDYAADLVSVRARARRLLRRRRGVPRGSSRRACPLEHDVEVLKAKRDAGAEFAVTEMVLRASDYFGLVERARARRRRLPDHPGRDADPELTSMSEMVELSGRADARGGARADRTACATTPPPSGPRASRSPPSSATTSSPAAPRACTSTR